MKRIIISLIVLFLLASLALVFSMKSSAAGDIAAATTEALGLETTFGEASLGLLTPQLQLKNLVVENPEGFGELPFVTVESVTISLRLSKLAGEVVEIPQIVLDGLTINLIQSGSSSNVTPVLSTLIGHRLRNDWGADGDDTRYRVERLVMRNVTIHTQANLSGSSDDTGEWSSGSKVWPEIVVEDFSGTDTAKPLPEVVGDIAQALFGSVLRSGLGSTGSRGLDGTVEAGLGVLESAGGILSGFFERATDPKEGD